MISESGGISVVGVTWARGCVGSRNCDCVCFGSMLLFDEILLLGKRNVN